MLGELEEEQPSFPGTGDEASLHTEMGRTVVNPQPTKQGWAQTKMPWGARDSQVAKRRTWVLWDGSLEMETQQDQ